jgi:hypothetical protein
MTGEPSGPHLQLSSITLSDRGSALIQRTLPPFCAVIKVYKLPRKVAPKGHYACRGGAVWAEA